MLVEMKRSAAITGVLVLILMTAKAFAHHGWSGYTEDDFILTGVVEEVELGNPHGHLMVRSDGGVWNVVLGPPARNRRAGITDGVIGVGDTVTAYGKRHRNPDQLEMKTERLEVGEELYDIYPNRR
ncbi:MAG TPA: DUF6152 family protein [Geminicoccaceae bacterium]|jgi:hypothetical protein|nr:DUF6152 family protein [Geminicoccaceae bacterium]